MDYNLRDIKSITNFLNFYLSPKSLLLERMPSFDTQNLLFPIADKLHDLSEIDWKPKRVSANNFYLKCIDWSDRGKFGANIIGQRAIENIKCHLEYYNTPVTQILVHGSQIDGTFVQGWSDLDSIVIVDTSRLKKIEDLITLREAMLKACRALEYVDPLCHHYFQVIPELYLNKMSKSVLPPAVISESFTVLGPSFDLGVNYIENYRNDSLISIRNLLNDAVKSGSFCHHGRSGIFLEEKFKLRDNNLYQFKYFLSLISLVPALYYNSIGLDMPKGVAIASFKSEFKSKLDMTILYDTTNVRREWGTLKLGYPIGNEIPEFIINTVKDNYFNRALKFLDDLLEYEKS